MNDEAAVPAPKKKGGRFKKLLLIGGGMVVLLGAGAAAGMYAGGVGLGANGEAAAAEDPDTPKLVLKDGEHDEEHASAGGGKRSAKEGSPDPSKYKATYYNIEQNFTSNLRDSDGFVQVALGVSTYYDQRVIDRLKEHEMAVRSAVLMTLADQNAFVITTPEGKKGLQKTLKEAINAVLKSKEGFGGVDDVYFTSFIIQ